MTLLAVALALPAHAQEARAIRSITVSGQAERKVVPDEAHVMLQVSAQNLKLAEAKSAHDQKLRKAIDIAKSAGIAEAQIKTQSSAVQPQFTYENSKRQFRGYQVATALDLTVRNTEALGGLVEKLTAAGLENSEANQWAGLMSVHYTLSNPDKLRDELLSEAIRNAHDKAQRMAGAAGASLGAVYQVSENSAPNFEPVRPLPMMALQKLADASAPPIAPPAGEQQINSTVTVTYELK